MKTRFLLFAALLLMHAAAARHPLTGLPASQTPPADTTRTRTESDSLRRIDPMPGDLVQLQTTGEPGTLRLQAGGYGLTLGRSYESQAREEFHQKRFTLTMLSEIELGFTVLTGLRYDRPGADAPGFPDQSLGNSVHFSFRPVGISYRAGKRRRSSFSLGMQYTVDNIRFANPAFALRNEAGRLVPAALEPAARKSKLRYTGLGFALGYSWHPVSRFRMGLTTHYDFLMHARAITKGARTGREKELLGGFSPFRFGLGASVAYRHVGFFVRYTPTSLFRASSGLEAQTLSYGCTLNF